ncbi:MAG: tetratricopeptide repeat protein [Chitinophagales bacterium]|nr:tetratricopeptide repeat protein [Chitinophagales bacterium]
MRRASIFIILFFSLASATSAEKYFDFTPLARSAYEKAISLRFGEAYALMAQLRLQEPDNLIVYHIENYIDFFTVYITEEEQQYKRLKKKAAERLAYIEQGNASSPYYLYVQADIRLQWALAKLRFEDYLGAFTDVSKAHKLLKANEEAYPNFMPNKKDLGILHAMVGTIPDSYKWGVKILGGLSGTIEQGKKEIESVLTYAEENDFIFEQETWVLYAFLLLHLNNEKEAAWQAVNRGKLEPANNPLHCFVMANIAMRTGKNDTAIRILETRSQGSGTIDFPYLDYMLGLAKLRRLDADAGIQFQSYLNRYQGRNFVKEAYQKLAWQALLNGDIEAYHAHMRDCRDKGYAIAGGDKSAQQEAKDAKAPQLDLLRARLLFDGGYYPKGYELLKSVAQHRPFFGKDELEYYYRLGRLCHGMKKYDRAIEHYHSTISKGAESKYYFACNAALQTGLIYEEIGDKEAARKAFEKCLRLKPEEYRLGLHQQAKAGLARLK